MSKANKLCTFTDRCCNPYNIQNHFVTMALRKVSANITRVFPSLSNNSKICSSCRKEISACIRDTNNGQFGARFIKCQTIDLLILL